MEKKINIAELLKDCPKGMELDCVMYEDVYFDYVDKLNIIHCYVQHENYKTSITFNQHGTPNSDIKSKCVIFPKGKTTWEGFQIPFKDGDIIYTHTDALKCNLKSTFISIFKECSDGKCRIYAGYSINTNSFYSHHSCNVDDIIEQRLATEEEKAKLFQAIKYNGYKWNPETKTLEKLPKFKVGDKIEKCGYRYTIKEVREYHYLTKCGNLIAIANQDNWELAPNKFDITTLKPFEKVLVRNKSNEVWTANFYSHYDATSDKPFICVGWSEMNEYRYCIPYEVNKELLGTTNNTEEYGSR